MILLGSMFLGMRIQWQTLWHIKHQVPVFDQCAVQQYVLLNQVWHNRMVRFLKPEGPKFSGTRTR
jgi:hypothetical protein